ncbi:hypothetical protein BZA05DRAFT_263624 [Tricharina praecox]|uniref:uncharacterized protein n=1 Tax=Tricharina praecox TaxID=43433 RepID=UPI00221F7A23|nr:uncharacterized protein BZA05DRAFT_263624 [Tricharina praecox]KAI5854355.1 hypothetical protein BZA05DRAFT_263624 [Tricharina praecox]
MLATEKACLFLFLTVLLHSLMFQISMLLWIRRWLCVPMCFILSMTCFVTSDPNVWVRPTLQHDCDFCSSIPHDTHKSCVMPVHKKSSCPLFENPYLGVRDTMHLRRPPHTLTPE